MLLSSQLIFSAWKSYGFHHCARTEEAQSFIPVLYLLKICQGKRGLYLGEYTNMLKCQVSVIQNVEEENSA